MVNRCCVVLDDKAKNGYDVANAENDNFWIVDNWLHLGMVFQVASMDLDKLLSASSFLWFYGTALKLILMDSAYFNGDTSKNDS